MILGELLTKLAEPLRPWPPSWILGPVAQTAPKFAGHTGLLFFNISQHMKSAVKPLPPSNGYGSSEFSSTRALALGL